MTLVEFTGLSALRHTVIMRAGVMLAVFALLCLFAESAAAQQPPQEKRDELDVTMQIIVDPDAKLPDEVVRRIPLPARKPEASPAAAAGTSGNSSGKSDSAGSGKNDAASEASEHGKETSQDAKERAREAADQREAARRAEAEERRREREPPDRPDPPNRPPRNN